MTPIQRKFTFAAHITFALGWFGAVVAYLVLAITGLTGTDFLLVQSCYLSMELIGWYVIVPLSLSTLATGLIQSLGTEWGLFRHYWIAIKFGLTVVGVIILLVHMQKVSYVARIAREMAFSSPDVGTNRLSLVVHAAGGLLLILTATALSVYKPWGRTRYGKRKQQQRGAFQ